MIGRLRGQLVDQASDGSVVVDVAGVGYEVFLPVGVLMRVARVGGDLVLWIHTHVREDTLTLYGFDAKQDRDAFRVLIGVSGVGPRSALAICGFLNAPALSAAISRKDWKSLTAAPGIGKRTAERIVLELENKIVVSEVVGDGDTRPLAAPPPEAPRPPVGVAQTVVAALVQMGYRRGEVELAVKDALMDAEPDAAPPTVEDLLRTTLRGLAG